MSDKKNIRILRGGARYAGAQDTDTRLHPLLSSDQRNMIEGDRNFVLNLLDQFSLEREYSTTYRPYGKIDMLYENIITGETEESRVLKYMYFTPDYIGCPDPVQYPTIIFAGPPCLGMPPAEIFDFIPPLRYGLSTTSQYNSFDAYQDNWVIYLSYVSDSNSGETMEFYIDYTTSPETGVQFASSDGIPCRIESITIEGKEVIRMTTPEPHGISQGEYIELQTSPTITPINPGNINILNDITTTYEVATVTYTNVESVFKVDFLGNEFANSDDYVINIFTKGLDPGPAPPPSIPSNSVGLIKRIINIDNSGETKSKYYTHIHKLITNSSDYTLDRTGFEVGIYNKKGRVFKNKKTPDGYGDKTVILEEFKSYLWNTNLDVDVDELKDNLNRPLNDLYLTIFQTNRNLMWHYDGTANSPTGYGWRWNFRKNGYIDPFVDNDVHPTAVFQGGPTALNGVDPLPLSGTTYRGAFVEYNPFELKERIISEIGHSLKFNKNGLYEPGTQGNDFNKSIYKFQPHHRIPIRKLSNTVSYEDSLFTSPPYATYSLSEDTFRWRSILPIDYFEDGNNGVEYPYLNDAHYPYLNVEFKIEPILYAYSSSSINIISEFVDVCE